jgi:hypothetical protein
MRAEGLIQHAMYGSVIEPSVLSRNSRFLSGNSDAGPPNK